MKKWPRLSFSDISRFHSFILGKGNLIHRLECEYKQGKAYRYFTNSFIGEILYHNIDEKSKFCLLKTKCVPSQRVNMKQYDVWVVCHKDLVDSIGGEILSAYCTYTAGLYGSCNHVACLLFRVDAAVLTWLSNPNLTSLWAAWNIPSTKKQIIPDEIWKFIFTKETYRRKATQESEETRKERAEVKQNFRVMTNSKYKALQNHKNVRNDLCKDVHTIIPTSCFVELMDSKQKKCKQLLESAAPTLNDIAKSFKDWCDPELNLTMLNRVFTDSLLLHVFTKLK